MPNKEEEKLPADDRLKKEEKDKHNALWAGVIFFMVLIIILWVMNLGMVFKSHPAKKSDDLNIDKLSQDFQKTFTDVGTKIDELKKIDAAELNKYPLLLSPSSTTDMTIKN
jgi:hypothetical protein